MDQRKLMDNANTITDMAKVRERIPFYPSVHVRKSDLSASLDPCLFQTQNSVYEIVSDMSGRQDALEERINSMEEHLQNIQERVN